MAAEVGKGFVSISADTKSLQAELGGLGALLGGKMGPLGTVLGKQLGSSMGKGVEGEVGAASGPLLGLTKMLGAAGPWGIAAGAAVASAAAIGAGLYKLGSDFETNYRTIARDTGATGTQLAILKKSFNDVLAAGPATMGQVASTISDVQRYTGIASPALDSLSKSLLTVSRISGTDVAENTTAAIHAFENWNIPASQSNKLLNEMYAASQKSGIGISTLAEGVTKFGPPLRTMGFSFQDSVAMMAEFGKTGVNSQRVFQGMQTAAAKFAKAGDTDIPGAMKQAISSIKGATSETDALKIGVADFGTRGATQFVDAIRSGKFNMDEMTAAMKNGGTSIDDTAKRTATLKTSFGTLKNSVEVALQPMASSVWKTIQKDLIDVAKAMVPMVQALSKDIPIAMKDLQPIMATVGRLLGNSFKVLGDAIKVALPLLKAVFDVIGLVVDLLTGKWSKAWGEIGNIFRAVGQALSGFPKLVLDAVLGPFKALLPGVAGAIGGFFNWLASLPGQIVNAIGDLAGTLWGYIDTAWSVIVNAAETGVSAVWGWLSALPGRIVNGLAALGGDILHAIAVAFQWIVTGAETGVAAVWGWLSALPGRIVGGLASLGGALLNSIAGAFGQVVAGAETGIATLWGWLTGLPATIQGYLSGAGTWLLQAGEHIIDGLVKGITGAIGKVGDAMSSIASKVTSFLPFSPAKEGPLSGTGDPKYSGAAIVQSLAGGITGAAPLVTDAMGNVLAPISAPNLGALSGGTTATGAAGLGPAIAIENVNLHDNLDVEAFMKQAAWVVKTQGI